MNPHQSKTRKEIPQIRGVHRSLSLYSMSLKELGASTVRWPKNKENVDLGLRMHRR
jgi:hypothetical protein